MLGQADYISTVDTKRKFILRVPLAACPRLPWPPAEPTHRARHALHRVRHRCARRAHQTRRSMAVGPSASPRLFSSYLNDAVRYATRMPCTGLHRGRTQCIPLSAPEVCTMYGKQQPVPWSCVGPTSVFAPRTPAGQLGCRARGWTARLWAVRA